MDPTARLQAQRILSTDVCFGLDAVPMAAEDAKSPMAPSDVSPAAAPAQLQHATLAPAQGPPMNRQEKAQALAELQKELTQWLEANWPRDGWQNVVFGEGDPNADLMFVGEGPGADEDRLARPFIGRAGQLLDKQIAAMGLKREQVYIANIAKCRPPGNRVPTPEEAEKTLPYLERQIQIIQPKVIVSLGATSAKYLLQQPKLAITKERGQWRKYCGIDLMPTFHPAYLLRQYTADNRQKVWTDLKNALERLGLPVPA
jgi:uracil-DNA glycosylase family 4